MNSINLATLMLMLLRNQGGLAAPTGAAISGSAVIGQTLTASATGTVTSWQWKRGGSNISSATNQTYVLVDADFGYAITVSATNASGSDTSAATALVAELPAESLGAELLPNPNMDWSAGSLTSWPLQSPATTSSDPGIREVASDGSAGTGAVRLLSTATNVRPLARALGVATVGNYYQIEATVSARTSGTLNIAFTAGGISGGGLGVNRAISRASGVDVEMYGGTAPTDMVVDSASFKALSRNSQLTAPSANMRLTQLYTLPASPAINEQFWIPLRISDWSAGNYWLAYLIYTGSQWNINLYSVATHTRTSRIAATNIGATNGIRVNANGDNWTLETTANGGTNWTSRGTVTNATYNTATGVNALWTSGFTAGNLAYEAAV